MTPSGTPVDVCWAGMSLPCPVPVTPDGSTDAPMSERTQQCGAPAQWWMGAQNACEAHMRTACGIVGIDFEALKAEVRA